MLSNFVAARAIDGDLSTAAGTTSRDEEGWIKINFDQKYFIHKVVIYYWFYNNWYDENGICTTSEARFVECAEYDGDVDVSVYQGDMKQKSCGTLQLTHGLEQSDQIYTLLCNTEGDTVKFSKNKEHVVVLEVAVISRGLLNSNRLAVI